MARTTYRPAAAAAWMLGSIAGFSALAVSGRQIGTTLDTFEIMLYRSLIGVAVVLLITIPLALASGGGAGTDKSA